MGAFPVCPEYKNCSPLACGSVHLWAPQPLRIPAAQRVLKMNRIQSVLQGSTEALVDVLMKTFAQGIEECLGRKGAVIP